MNDQSVSSLAHFPIPVFAAVMGTSGLALAWRRAEAAYALPAWGSLGLTLVAIVAFLLAAGFYGAKLLKHPQAARAEFAHPIRVAFFPAITISLLLLATALQPWVPALAHGVWMVGAIGQLTLTLIIFRNWLHKSHFQLTHLNPAWFIPVVGNIVAPIGGVGWVPSEFLWFFFSLGLFFWVCLMTILLYRLFFHEPLPERMLPTLFILLAPPSVGTVSYVGLAGGVNPMALGLYSIALFLAGVLLLDFRRFWRLPFGLPSWGYSFPMAALTIASFTIAGALNSTILLTLASILLAVVTVIILALWIGFLGFIRSGHLFTAE
jgi:tellurite resistance protein